MELLRQVRDGEIPLEQAHKLLQMQPFEDLGYAKVDHHRRLRQGAAEVVYGAGKTPEQILGIARALLDAGEERVLITRMSSEAAQLLQASGVPLQHDPLSRVGVAGKAPAPRGKSYIAVVTGGTSDMPVAEEAAQTAEALGSRVERVSRSLPRRWMN